MCLPRSLLSLIFPSLYLFCFYEITCRIVCAHSVIWFNVASNRSAVYASLRRISCFLRCILCHSARWVSHKWAWMESGREHIVVKGTWGVSQVKYSMLSTNSFICSNNCAFLCNSLTAGKSSSLVPTWRLSIKFLQEICCQNPCMQRLLEIYLPPARANYYPH